MISKNTVLKTNLDCAATPRGVAALPTGASVLSMKRVENRSLLVFRIPLCVGIDFSGALESASTIENGNPMIMAFASLVNATVSGKSESVSVHCMEVPRRAGNSRQGKSGTGQSESGTKPRCFSHAMSFARGNARARARSKQGALCRGGYIDEGVFAGPKKGGRGKTRGVEPKGCVTRRFDCRIRKGAMDSLWKLDLKGFCVRRFAKVGINKGFREPEFALALSSARDPAPRSVNKGLYLQVFQSPEIGIPLKPGKWSFGKRVFLPLTLAV